MTNPLINRHCTPLPADTKALSLAQCQQLLAHVSGWTLSETCRYLRREFTFKQYYETMAFVNALAYIAHQEDHHPELTITYNRCIVRYDTHTVNGLSENDFICAAKINALS